MAKRYPNNCHIKKLWPFEVFQNFMHQESNEFVELNSGVVCALLEAL